MSFYWLMTQWTSVSLYDWEQRIAGGGHFFDVSTVVRGLVLTTYMNTTLLKKMPTSRSWCPSQPFVPPCSTP
jgi:hypothetical protein